MGIVIIFVAEGYVSGSWEDVYDTINEKSVGRWREGHSWSVYDYAVYCDQCGSFSIAEQRMPFTRTVEYKPDIVESYNQICTGLMIFTLGFAIIPCIIFYPIVLLLNALAPSRTETVTDYEIHHKCTQCDHRIDTNINSRGITFDQLPSTFMVRRGGRGGELKRAHKSDYLSA